MAIPRNLSNLAPGASSTGVLDVTKGGTGLTSLGASGQVLQSNGTSLTWATPASGSMTLIQTQTLSGKNNVTFTSLGSYTRFILQVVDPLNANDAANNILQIGTGSPATYITSGYTTSNFWLYSSGGTPLYNTSGGTGSPSVLMGQSATYGSGITSAFINIGSSGFSFTALNGNTTGSGNGNSSYWINGSNSTTGVTAFKISNGSSYNWTGGSASLYGITV